MRRRYWERDVGRVLARKLRRMLEQVGTRACVEPREVKDDGLGRDAEWLEWEHQLGRYVRNWMIRVLDTLPV